MVLIETVHLQFIDYPMYTVTQYNFSRNGNGRKNYPRPFNSDALHWPLCEDSDKIPKGRTSTYILHLSALNQSMTTADTCIEMELEQCML